MKILGLFIVCLVICMPALALLVDSPTVGGIEADGDPNDAQFNSSNQTISESDSSNLPRKTISYQCKEGTKNFETKIVSEEDESSNVIVGDIEVKVPKSETQIIPLNMKLFFGPVLVGTGKGQVAVERFSSEDSSEGQSESSGSDIDSKKIIEIARKGNLIKGYYSVASTIEIKSGSCAASLPIDISVAKKHIDDLDDQIRRQEEFDKKHAACAKEIASSQFQGLYSQIQLCALKSCQSAVNSYMAAENRSGARSGFVDKVKLAAFGYYLEDASQTHKKLSSIAKVNGVAADCPASMLMKKDDVISYRNGTAMSCSAPVKYSKKGLSSCILSALGHSEEDNKFDFFNPTYSVYEMKGNKFDLSSSAESYARTFAEEQESEAARKVASETAKAEEDDPDVAAKKAAEAASTTAQEEQGNGPTWLLRLR